MVNFLDKCSYSKRIMQIINYLFIVIITLNLISCGKSGKLFLPNNEHQKWIEKNNIN